MAAVGGLNSVKVIMISSLIAKIFGTANDRRVRALRPFVGRINDLEKEIVALSDAELGLKTITFRDQLQKGRPLEEIVPEAFAVVREAARRMLGQRHYDVQLMG